nr:cytochrome P450 [Pharsalia antennata]
MMKLLEHYIASAMIFFIAVTVAAAIFVKYTYGYWKRMKVPYFEPTFPYGNSDFLFPKGISIGLISKKFYEQFKGLGHKIGGVFIGIQPYLVIVDPDMIKDVLVKDFQHFTDRGVYQTENEPLTVHLFTQPGTAWRNARIKLTSVFTSSKMKSMFETILACSEGLKSALEKSAEEKSDVDVLEVTACYTTDSIGSCAFGIECNSFKYPDADFRTMGRRFFTEFSVIDKLNLFLTVYAPKISQKLGVRNIQRDVSNFFVRTITDTVSHREKNNFRRNDLLQLLIDLKNSDVKLSMNELIAQVFLFFSAGFETSSSTTSLALFELSKRQELQEKLREEIREVLKRHDDKITYDAIAGMKYLAQAVDETLRIWPPVATITRVCTKDYRLQGTDITVEKDTMVLIPALGLHHDPDLWPEPEKFDPDRFSDENKGKIVPGSYMPFGSGPRNCIGSRFALLEAKVLLVSLMSRFDIVPVKRTTIPIKLAKTMNLSVKDGFWLGFKKRNK